MENLEVAVFVGGNQNICITGWYNGNVSEMYYRLFNRDLVEPCTLRRQINIHSVV